MANPPNKTSHFTELERRLRKHLPIKKRLSMLLKEMIVGPLARVLPKTNDMDLISFLFYHNVLDDEKISFGHQLKYLKRHGEIISLDQAIAIFEEKKKIGGRYFCITFDDGFKSCVKNALPILADNKCPAAFFIPTDYIGTDKNRDQEIVNGFFRRTEYPASVTFEFMNWTDCRQLANAGMVIGSHTCSHARLSNLTTREARVEMSRSKQKIEDTLGISCRHFCAPYGRPGRDLSLDIHPSLAKEVGFQSFLTVSRGPNTSMTDPFRVKRDYLAAGWKKDWLDYFFFCRMNCKVSYL
jgi:peptidoglycan/xylan/chitin deacetylase (PgdA/CDA1 family)